MHFHSDDRTGEALRNKLLGAVESKGLSSNGKPTLVVIDEIDGASQSGQGDNVSWFDFSPHALVVTSTSYSIFTFERIPL